MTYLIALFGTVAAYVFLAVLLLSLNIFSLWRWWVKASAIVVTTGIFVATYVAINGLIGWPSTQEIPDRFSLVATRIIEPDKASGAPGHLYMWVEEIDERNLPTSAPRAHEVVYTVALAQSLYAAQQKLNNGQEVLGEMLEAEEPKEEAEELTEGSEARPEGEEDDTKVNISQADRASGGGDAFLLDVTESLRLSDMPPPELPDKPF